MPAVKYKEGDWFAVPLRDGGFAVGVVARTDWNRIPLGFFFGPRRDGLPSVNDLARLKARDALLSVHFGDLGLGYGEWPIIGRVAGWDRAAWPGRPLKSGAGHGSIEGQLTNLLSDPANRPSEPPPDRIGSIRIDSRRAQVDDSSKAKDIEKLAVQSGIDWVQFPCTNQPSTKVLALLNERFFTARPEVGLRVWGRSGGGADLGFARLMTNVRRFAADCLTRATDVDAIAEIPLLERLSLGIYELEAFTVLERVPAGLTELSLGSTRSRKPSLAPLCRFTALRRLYLDGQSKEIEILATLQNLEDVTLRSITVPNLEFVANLPRLWSLDIKLGGIRDFSAIEGKQSIKYLEIWQVRELGSVDIVGRLPGLQNLFLQSLPHVQSLPPLREAGALRRVFLENMKGLHDFGALEWAPALEEFMLVDGKAQSPEQLLPVLRNPTVRAVDAGFGSDRKNDRFVDLRAAYGKAGRIPHGFDYR
jgi:hypothetical protein